MPAVPGNLSSSGEFVKQKVWESFPAHYHLATSQEAKSSETALHEVMPGWEIAYLADGTVGGALYGNGTTCVLSTFLHHSNHNLHVYKSLSACPCMQGCNFDSFTHLCHHVVKFRTLFARLSCAQYVHSTLQQRLLAEVPKSGLNHAQCILSSIC